jgi:hypothetical protein
VSAQDEARRLIAEGYFQVSRAHRKLARAPVGLRPEEALGLLLRTRVTDATAAGRLYLSKYAPDELRMVVSDDVMQQFRALGGGPYVAK